MIFDKELLLVVNAISAIPVLDSLLKLLVNEYFVPVALSLLLFYLWIAPEQRNKNTVVVAMISVGLVNLVIKIINLLYFRTRPFVDIPQIHLLYYRPTDSSFPSNAAAVVFAIAVAIWTVDKKLGRIAIIIATIYSLSRVAVGVHYPSDILVGALLGAGFSYILSKVSLVNSLTQLLLKVLKALRLEPLY